MSIMHTEIISVQNVRVKEWAQLLERRGRDKQRKYLIEGYHLVEEALKAGAPVETIVYSLEKGLQHELTELAPEDVEWVGVSQAVLEKCSDTQTPQGIFGVVAKHSLGPDELLSGAFDLAGFLDGYYDQDCYFNLPMHYLANLTDAWYLDRFKSNRNYVLATGWDDHCLAQNQALAALLGAKAIPHQLSIWDTKDAHNWPTWQRMAKQFL